MGKLDAADRLPVDRGLAHSLGNGRVLGGAGEGADHGIGQHLALSAHRLAAGVGYGRQGLAGAARLLLSFCLAQTVLEQAVLAEQEVALDQVVDLPVDGHVRFVPFQLLEKLRGSISDWFLLGSSVEKEVFTRAAQRR